MTDENRDAAYMAAALALGRRNLGRAAPNPAVGALVVKDGVILGRGCTGAGSCCCRCCCRSGQAPGCASSCAGSDAGSAGDGGAASAAAAGLPFSTFCRLEEVRRSPAEGTTAAPT